MGDRYHYNKTVQLVIDSFLFNSDININPTWKDEHEPMCPTPQCSKEMNLYCLDTERKKGNYIPLKCENINHQSCMCDLCHKCLWGEFKKKYLWYLIEYVIFHRLLFYVRSITPHLLMHQRHGQWVCVLCSGLLGWVVKPCLQLVLPLCSRDNKQTSQLCSWAWLSIQ